MTQRTLLDPGRQMVPAGVIWTEAIRREIFSPNPEAANYAALYIYCGRCGGVDEFREIGTGRYLRVKALTTGKEKQA